MFNFFKRKLSVLEEMAGVELPPSPPVAYSEPRHWPPPPPPVPNKPTYAPMPTVKPPKEEMVKEEITACPHCGTFDCISLEEYQQRINITGAGVLSVRSQDVLKNCTTRQQINRMKEIEKDNPGIWGKEEEIQSTILYNNGITLAATISSGVVISGTGSTGPK